MPISSNQFEEIPEDGSDGPTPGTNAARIVTFLRENPDRAFTQTEISRKTGVKAGSVGPTLVRLRERGRVEHRGTYWRISDYDRSIDAAVDHSTATLENRENDEETPSMEHWEEHAVDPRERRDER